MENVKGYIISEDVTISQPKIISDKEGGITSIETILQEGEKPNRNKRIYPTNVIKFGLNTEYVQERERTKSWYGEAGHPLQPSVERQLYIDQSNISHIIVKHWWDGDLLMGNVECAMTARGRDMQGLIRQGSQVAFSMRGFGPVSEKKGDIVMIKEPLHILTYDWVIHPSHRPAYMTKLITESTSFIERKQQEKLNEEGYFIPLTESSIKDFLNESSHNIKSLKEQLGFDNGEIIGKQKKLIYLQEGSDILAVYLEDNLLKDIDHHINKYLSNF